MHHTPNSSAYSLHTHVHAVHIHTRAHTHSYGDSRTGQLLIPLQYSPLRSSNAENSTCFWPVLLLGTNCFWLVGYSPPGAQEYSLQPPRSPTDSLPGPLPHTLNATQLSVGKQPTRHTHTSHNLIFGVINKFVFP